jgi:branched-chain amino acid transport system substrate-binding protein
MSIAIAGAITLVASSAAAQTVVRIGHVASTTGSAAHWGKDNELGAKLAVADLNIQGVKLGGQAVRIELMTEDDAGDPRQATAAAARLVDAKVAGVIGHLTSGTTIPASRIYHDAGIPQITPSATNPKYTQQGFNSAFRMVSHDGQLGGTLGRYAVADLKAKNIAIIDDRTAYGQGIADEFQKAVKAAGGKVIGREFTNDKATDFNAILTKLKASKPDLIMFGGMDAVAGPMLRQMKQLGMTTRFLGGDGICTSELVKLAGDAIADGQVVCAEAGGVTKDKEAAMNAWRARFRDKTGQDVLVYAPNAYDAVMVMVAAMQKADSADPKKYLPELQKTQYNGVTGRIAYDQRGDLKEGTLTLFTYKAGKKDPIKVMK